MRNADQWIEELTGIKAGTPSELAFLQDCVTALRSKNWPGVCELVHRMNSEVPEMTAPDIWRVWNYCRSPVRNFLILRHIDFPEGK